jgi:H3 lysine-79-specific histone-lysine N-methyltransferase
LRKILACESSSHPYDDAADLIVDYIPPPLQHIFGTLSSSLDLDLLPQSNLNSSRLSSPNPDSAPNPPADGPTETIADALRKALAPNRRDGPGLLKAMERYNTAMEEIQLDGTLQKWMQSRSKLGWREWTGLCEVIGDQAYGRIVGPFAEQLAVSYMELREIQQLNGGIAPSETS